jgi:hypothetical protein
VVVPNQPKEESMATSRGELQSALATPVQFRVRPITLALVALVAAVALTLAIVLAAGGGGAGDSGYRESVRVAPSAEHIPTQAERNQDPGLNGPGMRP